MLRELSSQGVDETSLVALLHPRGFATQTPRTRLPTSLPQPLTAMTPPPSLPPQPSSLQTAAGTGVTPAGLKSGVHEVIVIDDDAVEGGDAARTDSKSSTATSDMPSISIAASHALGATSVPPDITGMQRPLCMRAERHVHVQAQLPTACLRDDDEEVDTF